MRKFTATAIALAALLITGCEPKDELQLPTAKIENPSGKTTIAFGESLTLEAGPTGDLPATIMWSVGVAPASLANLKPGGGQTPAPAFTEETFEFKGNTAGAFVITLTVTNADGIDTDKITVTVQDPEFTLLDFESVETEYLAGPTSKGENLYADFDGEQYTGYTDAATGLKMEINEVGGARNFWNGGVAVSQWNDMTVARSDNQCSVYFKDASNGQGGYGGSKTFAVVNYSAYNNAGGALCFADANTEAAFDHVWVTNTTYAALSMKEGDAFAKKFTYEDEDWFLLTISAEDKAGLSTGTPVKFYLADFRTASSPGIVTEWTKVDLTPLGENVHKLTFNMSSSDTGYYGMNTPGYVCFDNLAFYE